MATDTEGRRPRARIDWAETGFGLFLLALCGVVLLGARSIKPAIYDNLGSAALPVAAAVLVAAMTVWTLWRSLMSPGAGPAPPDDDAATHDRPAIALGFVAITAAYAALLTLGWGGFTLLSLLYLAAGGLLLARAGGRTAAIVVAIALTLSVGGGFLFTRFFYIALP
jgi:hypothetical protein